jgi:hypothetical protein
MAHFTHLCAVEIVGVLSPFSLVDQRLRDYKPQLYIGTLARHEKGNASRGHTSPDTLHIRLFGEMSFNPLK